MVAKKKFDKPRDSLARLATISVSAKISGAMKKIAKNTLIPTITGIMKYLNTAGVNPDPRHAASAQFSGTSSGSSGRLLSD